MEAYFGFHIYFNKVGMFEKFLKDYKFGACLRVNVFLGDGG